MNRKYSVKFYESFPSTSININVSIRKRVRNRQVSSSAFYRLTLGETEVVIPQNEFNRSKKDKIEDRKVALLKPVMLISSGPLDQKDNT